MSTGHKHKHHYKEKVHCYKAHKSNVDTNMDDIWIYYYVILMSDNSCYCTTSPNSISDFSKSTWTSAKENPMKEVENEEELPEQELSLEELPEEIQGEMETNPEEFDEATPETEVDAETSTDASDAEGGDGGDAGDSGGGDFGDGGE